jgi:hypothetical protein
MGCFLFKIIGFLKSATQTSLPTTETKAASKKTGQADWRVAVSQLSPPLRSLGDLL